MKFALCAFAVSALVLPSVAHAQLDSSVRACATDGTPTFYPRQGRWNTVPDLDAPGTSPIFYYFDSAGAPNLSGNTSEWDAVNRAFDAYNLHECTSTTNSFANLRHINGGIFDFQNQTIAGTSVNNRDQLGDEYQTMNGEEFLVAVANIVRWTDTGESFAGDSQTLAVTSSLVLNTTEIVVQSDMTFNSINFQWRTASGGCTPSNSCHDVFTIALHEAGHYIGLGHVDCTDAVMYSFHQGVDTTTGLSVNETAGLCALYPPRNFSVNARVFGEQCAADDDCDTGLRCVPEPQVGAPFAVCSQTCGTTLDCPNAFICRAHPDGYNFCAPGSDASAPSSGGNGDPDTGRPVDFCAPCSSGSQCSNGICANIAGEDPICTQTCAGSLGCPTGFTCSPTNQQYSVCVPDNPALCGGTDSRSALNEICFAPGLGEGGSDFQNPCQGGLACFQFRTGVGACVVFCDAFSRPYNNRACPEPDQTCCYAVDADGACISTPPPNVTSGGCFDIREVGQSCVVASNAVCEPNSLCIAFQGTNSDRCFRECTTSNDCTAGSDCRQFLSDEENTLSVCCDSQVSDTCNAVPEQIKFDIGVACRENADCQSGLCIRVSGGQSACSRNCNPVTANECPADDADVNGDGRADGPFECRRLDDQFYCWPENGPVLAAENRDVTPEDSGGCSCRSGSPPAAALLFGLLLMRWVRRRRRA